MAPVQILHVEDDPIQPELVAHHLEAMADLTFELTWVTSEAAALEAFQQKTFDLVILDYLLQRGNGLHLLRELRQLNPVIPIIAVSGVATEEVAAKLVRAGADDYFSKRDLNSEQLSMGIRNALRRAEGIRQRLETARVGGESAETALTVLCQSYARALGPDLMRQLDSFEAAARAAGLTAPQLEALFSKVIAQLELSGKVEGPALIFRPLILESLVRLFDDVPPAPS